MLALVRRSILDDLLSAEGACVPTPKAWPASLPDFAKKVMQSAWESLKE
jgi:hypothetical protein